MLLSTHKIPITPPGHLLVRLKKSFANNINLFGLPMFVSVPVGGYAQNSPDALLAVSKDETSTQMQKSVES